MKSASDSILRRIRVKQRGWVFTPKDFIDLATRSTILITEKSADSGGTINSATWKTN